MGEPTWGGDEPRSADDGGPEPSDADVEASWAEMTARLGPLWSADEAQTPASFESAIPDATAPTPPAPAPAPQVEGTVGGPRDYSVEEDDDEGYVPPEPEPIDASDPISTMAWAAAVGGPLLTIVCLVLWSDAPRALYIGTLVASVLGWVTLMWRMPRDRSGSDGDGAVV